MTSRRLVIAARRTTPASPALIVGLALALGCAAAPPEPSDPGGAGSTGGGANGGSGGSAQTMTGAGGGSGSASACDAPGLVWKTARKTTFTSYPAPGSEECINYSGCMYQGQFAACSGTKPKSWVMSHNIAAFFPNFSTFKLHDLCLRSGSRTIVVTVYDTCSDSDCSGCCTRNKGSNDALVDLESFTNARFGVDDGQIQWADLGPTRTGGCD